MEKEKITDKEFTYLSLKWGTNWAVDLAVLRNGARKYCDQTFSELEHRAADFGEEILRQWREEATKTMADEIKKDIDKELIKTITELANGS